MLDRSRHFTATEATGGTCDVSARATGDSRTRDWPHVVIVGAGFGGLSAAKALAHAPVRVTLIDRRNYHLFQPLLYQVATAALSPADIATPIRTILRRQKNTTVLLAEVIGVDNGDPAVVLDDRRIPYDYLVLATGARHAYFGHDEWEPFAPGLKTLDDATAIRRRVLMAFELAEAECDMDERQRLLNFVVIGGGPTGVELAGAIAELANKALTADFRNIDPHCARVILIEAGPRLLPSFPESLSDRAHRALTKLGVEVRLGRPVIACDERGVRLGEERLPAYTVIWGAGVAASPPAVWLNAKMDRSGRVVVGPDLSVPGLTNVFVIGDTASAAGGDGKPLPGVAPVAKQQGQYVAKLIKNRVTAKAHDKPFKFRNFGNMATIGRKYAVADFGFLRLGGFPAWVMWCFVHIYFLIGFRNRMVVLLNWIWAYVTFQRGARLITGIETGARLSDISGPTTEEVATVLKMPALERMG